MRGLIVAKDKYIEELYMYDRLESEEKATKLLTYPVSDFEILYFSGLLENINNSCHVMITDYHMEIIRCETLPCVIYAVDHARLRIVGPYMSEFCAALRHLCLEGINRGTSLIADF